MVRPWLATSLATTEARTCWPSPSSTSYGAKPRQDGTAGSRRGRGIRSAVRHRSGRPRGELGLLRLPRRAVDLHRRRQEGASGRGRSRSLDCSGFLRMVYGYRMGYPLRGTNTKGTGLPRRAYAIAGFGPGVQLVPNNGKRPGITSAPARRPVVLPRISRDRRDGPATTTHIEHSGMYLGIDDRGHHRFDPRAG